MATPQCPAPTTPDAQQRPSYYYHGCLWAKMVKEIQDELNSEGIDHVSIQVGNDMEIGWNFAETTRAWVDGFVAADVPNDLYNTGDAVCPVLDDPPSQSPGVQCLAQPPLYGDWTHEDVWYVSGGASSKARALPQIYNTRGEQALQWKGISVYAHKAKSAPVLIVGAMTQRGACQQQPPCAGTDNPPATGWWQLWTALNGDPLTSQGLPWSIDIRYQTLLP